MQDEHAPADIFSETNYREYTFQRSIIGPTGWKLIYTLETDRRQLFQLDREITTADRSKFLTRLFSERREDVRMVRSGTDVVGFLAGRPGARAWQIGPCLSTHAAGAMLLDGSSLSRHSPRAAHVEKQLRHFAGHLGPRLRHLQESGLETGEPAAVFGVEFVPDQVDLSAG